MYVKEADKASRSASLTSLSTFEITESSTVRVVWCLVFFFLDLRGMSALAHAVYSQSDVIFLDDPLSTVNAPTTKHLVRTMYSRQHSSRKDHFAYDACRWIDLQTDRFRRCHEELRCDSAGTPEKVEQKLS